MLFGSKLFGVTRQRFNVVDFFALLTFDVKGADDDDAVVAFIFIELYMSNMGGSINIILFFLGSYKSKS